MTPCVPFESSLAILDVDHVDTDQIIPARFLKGTTREGLGAHAFQDWRYDEAGNPRPDFPLNAPGAQGAAILVAGDNFGCGSSREHAPWALSDLGFRAVVAVGFADIFHQNALKNALLPIRVERAIQRRLVAAGTGARARVDLERSVLVLPDGEPVSFPVDPFIRRCLLMGVDELGYLLRHGAEIDAFEAAHPPSFDTRRAS